MLQQVEDSIGIAVFLDNDISSDEVIAINDEITAIDHVETVKYISPEDALTSLKAHGMQRIYLQASTKQTIRFQARLKYLLMI